MEHLIPLVITNLYATELKDGRLIGRMKVYATVSISGGPPTGYNSVFTTHVDMEGNNNPRWNTIMDFKLHGPSLRRNLLYLNFNFHCRETLDERYIGGIIVPINPLLAMISGNRTASQPVRYAVMTSSGEVRGFMNFCFGYGNSIRPLGPQQQAPQWRNSIRPLGPQQQGQPPQWRPPRPPHVALEAQQPAPQWQPLPPPHVALEAQQPAPQWQPRPPPHVALVAQQLAPQWQPPPPHVALEAQQPAPQWQPPPQVALEAQQPAPLWQPPQPPNVAFGAQLEVNWEQSYYDQANQYDYGDQADQYDYYDHANQYDYGDQANQDDYYDQANQCDYGDQANQYDYYDQVNQYDYVSDY